jgi:hypothetical protein
MLDGLAFGGPRRIGYPSRSLVEFPLMPAALRLSLPLLGLACLAGCGGREEAVAANQQVSAEGQAQTGKIRVKGPGLDMTFVLPKAMRGEAKAGENSRILYPRSTIEGLAMVGSEADGKKGGDSEVEFSFASADPPDRLIAWYRDPARGKDFRVTAVEKQGDDVVIHGSQSDGHVVKVRLGARPGGGTAGRVTIHHND